MKKLVFINELFIVYLKFLFINESSRVLIINSWKIGIYFKKEIQFQNKSIKK